MTELEKVLDTKFNGGDYEGAVKDTRKYIDENYIEKKERLTIRKYWMNRLKSEKIALLDTVNILIDGYKVDEVETVNIKTVSDIKEFFNQHLDEVKKVIEDLKNEL